jgi:hypothetical protein
METICAICLYTGKTAVSKHRIGPVLVFWSIGPRADAATMMEKRSMAAPPPHFRQVLIGM